jgi:hypothetical protein
LTYTVLHTRFLSEVVTFIVGGQLSANLKFIVRAFHGTKCSQQCQRFGFDCVYLLWSVIKNY